MKTKRIYLSPPNVDQREYLSIQESLNSGWIAPVGPAIDAFEGELCNRYNKKEVVALNSGTSALHLALVLAGVGSGDEVIVSDFTFAACANVVRYQGAMPVFIDSEPETWNMDPKLLREFLSSYKKPFPKAMIITHLYGMPAQIQEIKQIADTHNIVLIEDAAEALGSTYQSHQVGGFGQYGVLSFNGNKIITTSGGGALICEDREKPRALYLATQANRGKFGYEHDEVGYNYRMSNVLAALGLAQLKKMDVFISRKREIYETYRNALDAFFIFQDEPQGMVSNRWLTTCLLKEDKKIEDLILFLDDRNIESRRLWKPLHLHQAYRQATYVGDGTAERLFSRGICLPSGTGLSDSDQARVIEAILAWVQS